MNYKQTHFLLFFFTTADFEHGTIIIRTPGTYSICEDIQFCPNVPNHYDIKMPDTAYDPIFPSDYYDEYAFALGFHSAISIVTNNVVIDLNTYSIKQCESFSLMQRFFSLIELNLHPFINNTGSTDFVGPAPEYEQFQSGSNITIKGPGTLGRSTHNCKFIFFKFQRSIYRSLNIMSFSLPISFVFDASVLHMIRSYSR
jgi:hypothetical protein